MDPECKTCGGRGYGRCPCWYIHKKIPGPREHKPAPEAQTALAKLIEAAYARHRAKAEPETPAPGIL